MEPGEGGESGLIAAPPPQLQPGAAARRRWTIGLLILTMALAWSFNYIAGKIADRHMPALAVAWFRIVLGGAIFFGLLLALRRRRRLPGWRELPVFLLLGATGVAINQAGFTLSLNYTSVGRVALISASGPVMVLLMAWLDRLEPLTWLKFAGMGLAFAGIALLAGEEGFAGHSAALFGDLLALASTVGLAVFTVACKRVARRYDALTIGAYSALVGAVIALPLALRESTRLDWSAITWQGWAGMGYMAVIGSVVGYLAFYRLVDLLSASQVASLYYIQPVVATALGVLLLGERIGHGFLAAAALVAAGVVIAERSRGPSSAASRSA